jgi:small redox-active disulfide protein 2
MKIKILGTGCPNCRKLEADTKQALEELKMKADIEKITEIQDIMSYGVMGLQALVIDEKVEVYGRIPNLKEIKEILCK